MSLIPFLPLPPPSEGLLPYWLLLTGVVSMGNCVQAYLTTKYTAQVYDGTPNTNTSKATRSKVADCTPSGVTPLSSRTFGVWTFLAALVRVQASLAIHNAEVYRLVLGTMVLANVHFMLEWLVFGTARWGKGLAGPVVVSSVSLVWLFSQWGYYVR